MTGGSASIQGPLWGARARDWAEVQEAICRPLYDAILSQTGIAPNTRILDVGCGAGLFCSLAAGRGANVSGLDAAPALLEIAKERVPSGAFREGEMETLPYPDRTFDLVTGFNSFQFATRPPAALAEARRVARPGASVAIATWGKPEDCEAAHFLAALRPLLPPAPSGAPGPFALSADGALEGFARDAGLTPRRVDEVDCPFEYPDLETALRGLLAGGPVVRALQTSGEERVREAVVQAITPFRLSSGGYRLENSFLLVTATA
ncbi:MAG TPA: class I SAM-dependent methyltransferase [bacterium]|nr:class I SAM-dependent methyltransferase [bacterium]